MTTTNRTLAFFMPGVPPKSNSGRDFFVTGLAGREELSRLFHFQVDVVSRHTFRASELVRQNGVVQLDDRLHEPRYINGYVRQFQELGRDEDFFAYRLELVPWLWFLTQSSHCRVFQDRTALQIIETVLQSAPSPPRGSSQILTMDAPQEMPRRSYCAQYRESDFAFVSRLMEEEGLYYYFEHERNQIGLRVSSGPLFDYLPCPNQSTVRFHTASGGHVDEGVITSLDRTHQVHSGKITVSDYHYQKPTDQFATPEVVHPANNLASLQDFDWHEYPGRFAEAFSGNSPDRDRADVSRVPARGLQFAKMRMDELEVQNRILDGQSNCPHLASGYKFRLTGYPDSDILENFNREYLLIGVEHQGTGTPPRSGESPGFTYSNRFDCIPAYQAFRPTRSTPKPVVEGLQTASVVGPAREEIYTDKYGRVKIQFNWDLFGNHDQNSSCWVRVAQAMAGGQWGCHYWPRVGHEVLVAFLNGDPDRPIIVGSLYNGSQQPPYDLPQNQTRSGIKTRSSPNGSANNFNELRFEDKKDHEQIYVRAERNLDIVVENDKTLGVGHNRTTTIRNHDRLEVQGSRRQDIGPSGGPTGDTVDAKVIHGTRLETLNGDDGLTVQGDRGRKIHVTKGDVITNIDLGKYETEAMQSIELKVGGSSIKIDPSGIRLSGTSIKIDGEAIEINGTVTKISGKPGLQLQGKLVQIN